MNNTSLYTLNKSNLSPDWPTALNTFLNPQTLELHITVGNQVIDTQSPFDDTTEESWPVSSRNEFIIHPFLNPNQPVKDAEDLLLLAIPTYVYHIKMINDQKYEIQKQEEEYLIPTALNAIHKRFTYPPTTEKRDTYAPRKEMNGYANCFDTTCPIIR
ncbi:uncharacterized protein BX664DRAFT_342150 [Halteromyces radiatus]|uniref:uncharacterized protein n=1 Tax=Halteromyces radiatus TaxID=101107 RepID=UPI00221EF184|nr:uncharacterized protein BX664DRAFT_342150 [Halteromyces radiatus]KAI8080037.1 hypothetical protein BX664DRAFT_342150 [Halteromyces radiatus]